MFRTHRNKRWSGPHRAAKKPVHIPSVEMSLLGETLEQSLPDLETTFSDALLLEQRQDSVSIEMSPVGEELESRRRAKFIALMQQHFPWVKPGIKPISEVEIVEDLELVPLPDYGVPISLMEFSLETLPKAVESSPIKLLEEKPKEEKIEMNPDKQDQKHKGLLSSIKKRAVDIWNYYYSSSPLAPTVDRRFETTDSLPELLLPSAPNSPELLHFKKKFQDNRSPSPSQLTVMGLLIEEKIRSRTPSPSPQVVDSESIVQSSPNSNANKPQSKVDESNPEISTDLNVSSSDSSDEGLVPERLAQMVKRNPKFFNHFGWAALMVSNSRVSKMQFETSVMKPIFSHTQDRLPFKV